MEDEEIFPLSEGKHDAGTGGHCRLFVGVLIDLHALSSSSSSSRCLSSEDSFVLSRRSDVSVGCVDCVTWLICDCAVSVFSSVMGSVVALVVVVVVVMRSKIMRCTTLRHYRSHPLDMSATKQDNGRGELPFAIHHCWMICQPPGCHAILSIPQLSLKRNISICPGLNTKNGYVPSQSPITAHVVNSIINHLHLQSRHQSHHSMERMALQWMEGIPIVTKLWCCAIAGTSALVSSKLITGDDALFVPHMVWAKGQLWRIPLTFFYSGPMEISLIYTVLSTASVFSDLESAMGGPFEFLWLLATTMLMFLGHATYQDKHALFSTHFSGALLYYWAKRIPNDEILLFMVVNIKAKHYCTAVLAIALLSRKYTHLLSASVGHILFFSYEVLPKIHGFNPLAPPWVLMKQLKARRERNKALRAAGIY